MPIGIFMPAGDTIWEGKVPLALGIIESETQKDKQTDKQTNKQTKLKDLPQF